MRLPRTFFTAIATLLLAAGCSPGPAEPKIRELETLTPDSDQFEGVNAELLEEREGDGTFEFWIRKGG